MIKREKYLRQIREFYDSDLIKIITGVRRCGKSVILEQIMQEIREKSDNVLYVNFEDRIATAAFETAKDIVDYVKANRKQGLCYVFLDEIQEIDSWASACRSLRAENCSVFITGSNSKLLSKEFTRELSGRYIAFRVRPFVYKELKAYAEELGKEIPVTDYLVWGGFPKRLEFSGTDEIRRYLSELDRTIVRNDIINRYKIRKTVEFGKLANFIAVSNSRIYSANSIAAYMNGSGLNCTPNSIQKWIFYLTEAYIIDEIPRYSARAKRELEASKKIYSCDVALNSIRCTNNRFDLSHNLENVIYNELVYRDYNVSVFENRGREIDFLARKDNKQYYIQAAYSVENEKTYEREFSAFNGLTQLDRKIIITNDEIDYSTSNIQHIRLKNFLLLDDLA